MTSHVLLPEGFAVSLGVKEFDRGHYKAHFLVYEALIHAEKHKEASVLAEKSARLLLKEWTLCGHVHENYCPNTGMGCNSPRSDKYYHWGALLGYIKLLQDGQTME